MILVDVAKRVQAGGRSRNGEWWSVSATGSSLEMCLVLMSLENCVYIMRYNTDLLF